MKSITYFLMIGFIAFLYSCGGGGGSSSKPSDVVDKMMTSIEKGNFDAAIDCIALEGEEISKEDTEKLNGLLGMVKGVLESKGGIKSHEVIEEEVSEDGETANVKIKYVYGNGDEDTSDYNLVKEDGKWKVKMN